jgi:hypothetical protein
VQGLAWDDFDRIDEAIEAGSAEARAAVPRLKQMLTRQNDMQSAFGKQGEVMLAEALR